MVDAGVIVLAAGSSSRMGAPKQLLNFGGRTLVRRAAETALASECRQVIVVLGWEPERIRPALHGLPVETVVNPSWSDGIGTSIRAGIKVALSRGLDGVVLALADQVLVTSAMLNRLLVTHRESGQPIVASRYAGTVGVPAFFSRVFFSHLLALEPDQGCKGIMLKYAGQVLGVDCPEAAVDVDTQQDYAQILEIGRPGSRPLRGEPFHAPDSGDCPCCSRSM
jgi:molybdenum cofactor cytidylyltransferase